MARDARSAKRTSFANAVVTTVAVIGGLLLVNVVFSRVTARADLSGAGLTRASELLVAGLDEPLQITAYFGKVPAENAYEQEYVETLLESYADASDGKVEWRKIDPFERGKELQQKLRADEGIDKLMWMSMVDDTPQQVPVYFHVKFTYLDKSELWVPPGRFSLTGLEYSFSSIIKRLAYPRKKVGVTRGFGAPEQAGAITAILADNYEVVPVDLASEDYDLSDLDVLIVNGHTQQMPQDVLLALDGHVLAGKPTLFLVRGMSFSQPQSQPGMPAPTNQPYIGTPSPPSVAPLLAHYGVQVGEGIVLDRRASVAGPLLVGGQGILVKELFPLVEAQANGEGDPLQGLSLIPLPFATPVALVEGFDELAGGQRTAKLLARSSAASYLRSTLVAITKEADLRANATDQAGPFDAGYALEGRFTSYVAAATSAAPAADATPTSPANTRMIVLGSADFASDAVLSMSQRHPLFRDLRAGAMVLQNLIDWLAQDQALVAARTKGAPPPIDALDPSGRRWVKWGNTIGMSVFLLLAGIVSWFVRERRRRHLTL